MGKVERKGREEGASLRRSVRPPAFPAQAPRRLLPAIAVLLAAACPLRAQSDIPLTFGGVGWVQYGQIMRSTDTSRNDYNGNSAQNSGAQISVTAVITERLSGSVGLGVYESHALAGAITGGGRVPVSAGPYIAEANFKFHNGEEAPFDWRLTGGYFPYNYNPDIKDLGLYLLRGPVYPGYLISGFETKDVLPISNILGAWFRGQGGAFRGDLLFFSETEFKPYFDFSLALLGRADLGTFGTIGVGVNFQRLLPISRKLSHEPQMREAPDAVPQDVPNPHMREYVYVDFSTPVPDTTVIGFDGTKVMANFSLDLKKLFGIEEALGAEDLKLYSEAAILGLATDKAHNAIYGNLTQRMPVMVGFNFPMFRLLDHMALEVEWYGSKFQNDIYRLVPDGQRNVSPIPYAHKPEGESSPPLANEVRDNWKWALHAAKTIQGHFKISGQVANDHFRPFGSVKTKSYETAFSTPADWYWMAKIAYWF